MYNYCCEAHQKAGKGRSCASSWLLWAWGLVARQMMLKVKLVIRQVSRGSAIFGVANRWLIHIYGLSSMGTCALSRHRWTYIFSTYISLSCRQKRIWLWNIGLLWKVVFVYCMDVLIEDLIRKSYNKGVLFCIRTFIKSLLFCWLSWVWTYLCEGCKIFYCLFTKVWNELW